MEKKPLTLLSRAMEINTVATKWGRYGLGKQAIAIPDENYDFGAYAQTPESRQ